MEYPIFKSGDALFIWINTLYGHGIKNKNYLIHCVIMYFHTVLELSTAPVAAHAVPGNPGPPDVGARLPADGTPGLRTPRPAARHADANDGSRRGALQRSS